MTVQGGNPLRQALWPLSLCYGAVAALRNWLFDARLRKVHDLGVPVVSVGNLTVGGTGKTPTVAWLCQLAHSLGRRPGVLARGYGRAPGEALNDEGAMLQQRLPWLLQEQDPDRVAAGQRLLKKGADFVVLDDGFQHRRLHRNLDLVCLDAHQPFGNGQCLPSGELREFRSGLRRAGIVFLTRASGLDEEQILARRQRVFELAGREIPVYACAHGPSDVLAQPTGEVLALASLRGQRVVLLSAIARPQSFRRTADELDLQVAAEFRHRDHHRFTPADLNTAAAAARQHQALLLCTEKDAPKLAAFAVPHHVLRIDLRFLGDAPRPAEVLL